MQRLGRSARLGALVVVLRHLSVNVGDRHRNRAHIVIRVSRYAIPEAFRLPLRF